MQNYVNSRKSYTSSKLLSSVIWQSLIWLAQLIIIGMVYFLFTKLNMIYGNEFVSFSISLFNCFGLLLVTLALGYSLGSIPRRLKNLLLSGKQITKKYMKFDIVVKKKEHILKKLEKLTKITFGLLNKHIPNDKNKISLRRIFYSVDNQIISDFHSNLSPDFEQNTSLIDDNYKKMNEEYLKELEEDLNKYLYEYTKLKQKERKLSKPIHFYEYSKKGFCYRLRNYSLYFITFFSILLSTLVFHLSISFTLGYYFELSFYDLFNKNSIFVRFLRTTTVFYLIVCVFYCSFKLEIKNKYLLVKRLTPLSSFVFYIK